MDKLAMDEADGAGSLEQALRAATTLVARCGTYAAEQQVLAVEELKASSSLAGAVVTQVDAEVERRIDAELAELFPQDGVLGEELVDRAGSSGRRWVVDPVDGTLNYARRLGPWSVVLSRWTGAACDLVAVWTGGHVYAASRGAGATLDGEPLVLHPTDVEAGGIVLTGAALQVAAQGAGWLARTVSTSAAEICAVADGRVVGTVRLHGHPRDLHGPALLVQEAGGRVTDPAGNPWDATTAGLVLASAGAHARLLELAAAAG